MLQNEFYTSLDIRADQPVDKRFYVNGLTTEELQRLFQSDGKYSFEKAFVFNTQTNSFYYLSQRLSPSDAIDPQYWLPATSGSTSFPEYDPVQSYTVGSAVFYNFGGNYRYFLGQDLTIAPNEDPINFPAKWFEITASEVTLFRSVHIVDPRDPEGILTRQFVIDLPASLGSNYPVIRCYGNFGVDENTYIVWEEIEPQTEVYNSVSGLKLRVTFNGVFDDLVFDELDPQVNIVIEVR